MSTTPNSDWLETDRRRCGEPEYFMLDALKPDKKRLSLVIGTGTWHSIETYDTNQVLLPSEYINAFTAEIQLATAALQ